MASLEAGMFLFMLLLGFIFTFISFKMSGPATTALRFLGMVLFLGLAIFIGSGYSVVLTNTIHGLTSCVDNTCTEIKTILPGGTDSYWLAWVFSGLGFMDLFFIVKELGLGAVKQ